LTTEPGSTPLGTGPTSAGGEAPALAPSDVPATPRPPVQGPRRLRSLLIGLVIAAVVAFILFVGLDRSSGNGSSGSGPVVGVGSTAPNFSIPSLTGGARVDLDALGRDRHRPVVLNFFASWCVPCQQETPLLARTAATERARHSTVQFIGVDALDQNASADPFVEKAGVTYPVGTDGGGKVSGGLYALFGLPQTYFIGADGTVIGHVEGAVKQAQLDQWLHRLGGAAG
jgi:cytochrome c biogenesis protein CcmG, thiol:disulfide interchange protein DsbE